MKEKLEKKVFSIECPWFCNFSSKCNVSNKECIYNLPGENKYCGLYNLNKLAEGRYSI